MRKQLCIAVLAVPTFVSPSLACYPVPDFDYDEIGSRTVAIATATVSAVENEVDGSQSCWHVRYSSANYLHGKGEQKFSVTTCKHEVYQIDLLAEEDGGLDDLGFVQEAEVLIGLVPNHTNPTEFRYAIPSCWGPLHFNLNKMPPNERERLMEDIRSQIASEQ